MQGSKAINDDLSTLQRVARPNQWQKFRIPLLDGGLHTDVDPVDLAPNQTPDILNLTLIAGRLRTDTGYHVFGSILTPFFGNVHLAFQVFNADGTSKLLLLTTRTVYELNLNFNQWQLVPWGSTYTSAGIVSAGSPQIVLTSVAGLAVNQFLGLPLDDGTQLPVTIIGIVGTTVSFTPPVPAGRNVPNASVVVHGAFLNGTLKFQPCIVPWPPNDWTIFTNNVDPIFYYDGTKLASLVAASDLPSGTTCLWMVVYHEFLFLFNTIEIGVARPQRVRMSNFADLLHWTPGGLGGASLAAIYDLLDTEDFIQFAGIIGPYLIIYRDTTIMRGTYYGIPGTTVFFEYMVYGEGVGSNGSVIEIGAEHAFVGNGDIYTYNAGYNIDSIGEAVFVGFLSAIGDFNAAQRTTLFCTYIADYDELWVMYPAGQNLYPNKLLRCQLDRNPWYVRKFSNNFVSAAPYLALASQTWATWPGTWASQTGQWDSRSFLANVPVILMCTPDTNEVMVYDYTDRDEGDSNTPIEWSVTTKDIAPGDLFQRWDSVRVYGQGDSILCECSIDGGQTFTSLGTFNLGAPGPGLKILTLQKVSAYIRFRLSGADPAFVLNWLEVWYTEESEW